MPAPTTPNPGLPDGILLMPPLRAFKVISVGKTRGFALIKAGVLRTVKIGRSTRVIVASLEELARHGTAVSTSTAAPAAAPPRFRRGN
jgi:hypothetical protein